MRVWRRLASGTEIEITTGTPQAMVYNDFPAGYWTLRNATWNCPSTQLANTDSIAVRIYLKGAHNCANFTTEVLGATQLDAATWTVYYYAGWYIGQYNLIFAAFKWGYSYPSRIENFQYSNALALPFADGFESGGFGQWSGKSSSSGESAGVVNTLSHHGLYSGRFASNGGGVNEFTYAYKTIPSSSALYLRGNFYVNASGLVEEGDRFYLLGIFAGSNGLAYAGWRKTGGVVKWCLVIKNGTTTLYAYSTSSPLLDKWYYAELHWARSTSAGHGELWVDGSKVITISGKNTAAYGDANSVRFGLPLLVGCGSSKVYGDCCVVSTAYVGPEPIFKDSFESGSFGMWSGSSVSVGETAAITSAIAYQGTSSARFGSNGGAGSEWAYCYKTIASSADLYARGYFRVPTSGIVEESDRFYFIRFKAGSNGVAYAGWRKTGGVVKWCLMIRNGTSLMTAYSASSPSPNKWYNVELHWTKSSTGGRGDLWVDGQLVCSIGGKNTAYYGSVNSVEFGLPSMTNCGSTTVYCDYCSISKMRIGTS